MPADAPPPSGFRHALHVAVRLAQLAGASVVALGVFAREAWRCRREGRAGLLRAFARAHVALCERLGATFIKGCSSFERDVVAGVLAARGRRATLRE